MNTEQTSKNIFMYTKMFSHNEFSHKVLTHNVIMQKFYNINP